MLSCNRWNLNLSKYIVTEFPVNKHNLRWMNQLWMCGVRAQSAVPLSLLRRYQLVLTLTVSRAARAGEDAPWCDKWQARVLSASACSVINMAAKVDKKDTEVTYKLERFKVSLSDEANLCKKQYGGTSQAETSLGVDFNDSLGKYLLSNVLD